MSKVDPQYKSLWKRVAKDDKPALETILRASFESKATLDATAAQLNNGAIKCPDNNGVWIGKHVSMLSIVLGMRRITKGRKVGKVRASAKQTVTIDTSAQDTKALIDLVVHNEQFSKEAKLRVLAALLED